MSRFGSAAGSWRETIGDRDLSGLRSEGREPGARRKKLAGYLKAANELRQTYQESYTAGWKRDTQFEDVDGNTPGAFADATVVRTGEEEMILFPSYATKHIKNKPDPDQNPRAEIVENERDEGPGDEEFWRQEWQKYEDDHAVVDVDVRGWVYTPFKGMMTRKQRIFIGLARQLVGIPAPPSQEQTPVMSRNPSPTGQKEHVRGRNTEKEEAYVVQQAEDIMKKGEAEAAAAGKGEYSERTKNDRDNASIASNSSRAPSPSSRNTSRVGQLRHESSQASLKSIDSKDASSLQRRASWNQPADMSAAELREANTHLMTRLKPFMSTPMANTAISIFFYNNEISRQRTVTTNAAGHFNVRAALDFVPTHVRVLASEQLSATEEVAITQSKGVSLISDIDDTIKHSAISSGAREIFRNAFIRELGDLTVEGVRDWYSQLASLGVKFHYVSNSPWQLFPVISKFFALAGLPPGSFHLKQYSGMLQGIFEPVAERKKGTLDRLARDFPERRFILVGDSGEADLEVYMDFVSENPGRVLAVFIRDVTTKAGDGFFDSSMGPLSGARSNKSQANRPGGARGVHTASTREEDDPALKAAIAASLRDMEAEEQRHGRSNSTAFEYDLPEKRPVLPPRRPTEPAIVHEETEDLIQFSDNEAPEPKDSRQPQPERTKTNSMANANINHPKDGSRSTAPMPPRKPVNLRSSSIEKSGPVDAQPQRQSSSNAAPPPPRRSSTSVSSSGQQRTGGGDQGAYRAAPGAPPKPSSLSEQYSYTAAARQKLASAYNSLPSASQYLYGYRDQDAPSIPSSSRPLSTLRNNVSGASRDDRSRPLGQGYSNPSNQPAFGNGARTDAGGPYQQLNKREQMWRQRWARAQEVLREHGVVLRSWRVGTDVLAESIKLVKTVERDEAE